MTASRDTAVLSSALYLPGVSLPYMVRQTFRKDFASGQEISVNRSGGSFFRRLVISARDFGRYDRRADRSPRVQLTWILNRTQPNLFLL